MISPALEHQLVLETVYTAMHEEELSHYAPIWEKPGFISALQDCFSELRSQRILPERFLEHVQHSLPARQELAKLYARYLARLKALNWVDQEGQSWLAIDLLERNGAAASGIRLVVVDGFTTFTGARRLFLNRLEKQVEKILISLPGDNILNRAVHRRAKKVKETLEQELSAVVTSPTWLPRLPEAIQHLEAHILDGGNPPRYTDARPFLFEARSHTEEAREALRWIKALHLREGVGLEQCAIYCSNPGTYQGLIKPAADEFGIRVHFTHSPPLAEAPTIFALVGILTLPQRDYRTRELFSVLHSPYFDFGLDSSLIEGLELVSQRASIVAGRSQWDEAWEMLESRDQCIDEEQEEDDTRPDPINKLDLASLRGALNSFWVHFQDLDIDCSLVAWVTRVEQLLERLHFYERINNQQDAAACRALGDTFKALILSESITGLRSLDYAHFLSELHGAVQGARVAEPREARQNAVQVGEMVEARASRFEAVALLGFSEGQFPVVENPDPFLDEELRRDLGLEARLQREQSSILYQALTRTNQHLLITRPYLAEDGEQWEASPYWEAVKNLFNDGILIKTPPLAFRPQADACSTGELLFWGVQQNKLLYLDDPQLGARWKNLKDVQGILKARMAKLAFGPYEGSIEQVSGILTDAYSEDHCWSASRLEEYSTCPLKFFVSSVMELVVKETPEPGLDARQVGSIYHKVLERVYRECGKEADVETLLVKLDELAEGIFKTAPKKYGFRPSALWVIEQEEFIKTLRKTIEKFEEKKDNWQAYRFEQSFGFHHQPALEIDLGDEKMRFHGFIDRVDRKEGGSIRVVDYKTGSSNLEKKDLLKGRRLQLPIYALAAQYALRLGVVTDGFYWKIREGSPSTINLSAFEWKGAIGPEALYDLLQEHLIKNLQGIRGGDFRPAPPEGACPSYCPAVQWCWRYKPAYRAV